ncbi:MAG: diguanylate cyclase [Janthinobacterium lividum]
MAEITLVDQAEELRVSALRSLGILDTEREPEFDQIVELAAAICNTPISSCTLVDATRQWFKATVGIQIRETERSLSFCSHAIQQPDLMVVEDTTKDDRFAHHPWVTGESSVRFYAGMPLAGPDGHMLGTLCVADTIPRQLTQIQQSALKVLTHQLKTQIELSVERQRLQRAVAEKEHLIQALQASDHRFRTFMNNGPFLSYIRDQEGRFAFYSAQVAQRFGVSMTAWQGKSLTELFPAEYADQYRTSDLDTIRSGRPIEIVEKAVDEQGASTYWRSYKFSFVDEHGNPMVGGMSVDITEEVNRRQELERSSALMASFALTDAVTGLANRRAADDQLKLEVKRATDRQHGLSVVLLDIDNFKSLNDTYGHSAGDEVLRRVGALLSKEIRTTDLAARYGGEEFIVILPEATSDRAQVIAERIRFSLQDQTWPVGTVTASFGVASFSPELQDPIALVASADEAMYQAKRTGKNRVVLAG